MNATATHEDIAADIALVLAQGKDLARLGLDAAVLAKAEEASALGQEARAAGYEDLRWEALAATLALVALVPR